jgi:hypothetical protein
MEIARGKICPSCGNTDSATATLCNKCGKELHPREYKIVSENQAFGITLNGMILYSGLELAKAQNLVTILKSTEEDGVA